MRWGWPVCYRRPGQSQQTAPPERAGSRAAPACTASQSSPVPKLGSMATGNKEAKIPLSRCPFKNWFAFIASQNIVDMPQHISGAEVEENRLNSVSRWKPRVLMSSQHTRINIHNTLVHHSYAKRSRCYWQRVPALFGFTRGVIREGTWRRRE